MMLRDKAIRSATSEGAEKGGVTAADKRGFCGQTQERTPKGNVGDN